MFVDLQYSARSYTPKRESMLAWGRFGTLGSTLRTARMNCFVCDHEKQVTQSKYFYSQYSTAVAMMEHKS